MRIIVGASRGIGKYLYEKYKNEGIKVIGTYNSTTDGELSKLDILDEKNIEEFAKGLPDEEIELIICSGISYNSFAHKANFKDWSNVINVNLIGTFNVIRSILPKMRNSNYGRIINFSSVVAQMGVHGTSAYAASKSGLWGLTKAIAVENANKNITINNINLGYFEIGMGLDMPKDYKGLIIEKIPSKSFGDPEDIFSTVEWIIGNSYLNGVSIDVNGGII